MGFKRRDPIAILFLTSLLRDDLPWLYELGMDAYRASSEGNTDKARKARHRFISATRMVGHTPLLGEIGDKDVYIAIKEIEHLFELFPDEEPPRLSTKVSKSKVGESNQKD